MMTDRLDYNDKIIMAPMVRIGTLPMRLLALDYGADIVYSEELIDWKLLRSVRRENDVLGTVDFIDKTDGTIIFRTCDREKKHVVLQLGTADAERALKVGKLVQNDVAGIDINMGCPKKFSLLGGMGAALLQQPEKAKEILNALVKGLAIPVTCKIRIFPTADETHALCKELVSTGIAAIAIHGRTKDERPQHSNHSDIVKEVAKQLTVPVIANGGSNEIEKHSDIFKFREETGCSSVMLARAAQWNCSIFRKEGLLPIEDLIRAYLKYAVEYDNAPSNTKYCIQNILRELQETPKGKAFLEAQTLEQICAIWDMDEYCRTKRKEYLDRGIQGRFQVIPLSLQERKGVKRKFEEDDVIVMQCAFLRNNYTHDLQLPKSRLLKWTKEHRTNIPVYHTEKEDKLFRSVVFVDGKKYSSSFWEKNRKWAEQGAALVCLCTLGVIDIEQLAKDGSIMK